MIAKIIKINLFCVFFEQWKAIRRIFIPWWSSKAQNAVFHDIWAQVVFHQCCNHLVGFTAGIKPKPYQKLQHWRKTAFSSNAHKMLGFGPLMINKVWKATLLAFYFSQNAKHIGFDIFPVILGLLKIGYLEPTEMLESLHLSKFSCQWLQILCFNYWP